MAPPRRVVLAVGLPGGAVDGLSGAAPGPGLGLDWADWRGVTRQDGMDGVVARLGDGPVLWRDPALWRVLPDCIAALNRAGWAASVLLLVRHPAATASALDGMPPHEALLLWLRATLDAEHASRALFRAVLAHDALLTDGQGALDYAGLPVPLAWDGPSAWPDVEPALPRLGSAYAEVWCRHAWTALRTLAARPGGREADAEAALDRVRAQFDDACRLFAPPAPPSRFSLPDVTLCAADSSRVALTSRALRHCQSLCAFEDAVLFTDQPGGACCRTVSVPPLRSRADYSALMLHGLVDQVRTDHVLVVQWDGFVVDPASWDESFRRFDYIGSRWADFRDGHDVGNGGFSLRSRRLLRALADPRLRSDPALLEDQQICRAWRPFLEREHGIRFAPPEVADRFSYERIWPGGPAFGFHGLFNAWRHLPDDALLAVAALLPVDVLRGREFGELAVMCFACGRAEAFTVLAGRWRAASGDPAVADTVHALLRDPGAAERCLRAAGVWPGTVRSGRKAP